MTALLVQKNEKNIEVALTDGKNLCEYRALPPESDPLSAEQLFHATVDRVIKGMNAAFVRLDKKTMGYMPLDGRSMPRGGDHVIVQVKKPPIGEKSAYVSEEITLAGQYVLLLPRSKMLGVSNKVTEPSLRAKMLETARKLCPEKMGLVMRTESADIDMSVLEKETAELVHKWEEIVDNLPVAPAHIKQEETPLERALRDLCTKDTEKIVTNAPELLPDFVKCPVSACESPMTVYSVRDKYEKALKRHVWLDSGGFLVVDKCEAMTVIDVNTGKFTGGKMEKEEMFTRLNCEAAEMIARVARLRDMGGILLIDFIDMEKEESRQRVLATMEEAFSHDRTKTVIHGFTRLGLCEMTRKRTRESADTIKERPCPYCGGTGVERTEPTDA